MTQEEDSTFTIRTRRWLVPAALGLGLFVSLATFFATGFHALVAVPALFLPLAVRLARGELQLLPDGLRLRDSFGQRDFAF